MTGGVIIRDPKKFDMRLESAVMDFKTSKMKSDKPTILKLEGGEISSKAVEFSQRIRMQPLAVESIRRFMAKVPNRLTLSMLCRDIKSRD